jgi:hypothetical protein
MVIVKIESAVKTALLVAFLKTNTIFSSFSARLSAVMLIVLD